MRMKRTDLVLDEDLLEEATRLSGEKTYSAAVMRALDDFVRRAKARQILGCEARGSGRATSPRCAGTASAPGAPRDPGRQLGLDRGLPGEATARPGLTVRSSVDCLIAACAIRHDLEVLHRDRDYPALAGISALRQRSP